MRRQRQQLSFIGGAVVAMVALALVVVGQSTHSAGVPTSIPAPTRPPIPVSCTPTPAARAPTFTIGPAEGGVANIQLTKIAAYQSTYPGDVIYPSSTTDLAPTGPNDEKYGAVVRHANCTYDKYLLLYNQLAGFEKNLSPGDAISAILPPSAALGHVPNTAPPPAGTPSQIVTRQASPVHTIAPPPLSVQQTVGSQLGPIPYDATKASITHTTPAATP